MNSSQCRFGVAASTCAETVRRQVRGERHGARLGNAREPHPAGDAADAHQVRHHVVAGAHLDGRLADPPAPPVLADLDRRGELGRQPRLRVVVVVGDRLLDPGEAQAVDGAAGVERAGGGQALVEVARDQHVGSDGRAHRPVGCNLVRRMLAAHAQLDVREAAVLRDQLLGLARGVLRLHDAEAAAVVGRGCGSALPPSSL